jgi:multicomponent K+:H+ antiporter subunit D
VFTARSLSEQAAFAVIGSTGTLMIAVAAWQVETLAAALYYLVHSTLTGAALFLVADVVARRRAGQVDQASSGPAFAQRAGVGLMFMAAAIAATGLPPLSGFIGKLLVLRSLAGLPGWQWAWAAILGTTLFGVIGFARTGSTIFWKTADGEPGPATSRSDMVAPVAALALLAALFVGAGPMTAFAGETAVQLLGAGAMALQGQP